MFHVSNLEPKVRAALLSEFVVAMAELYTNQDI
jgi:hypothetical protein